MFPLKVLNSRNSGWWGGREQKGKIKEAWYYTNAIRYKGKDLKGDSH
jgi:hypothetical protein